MSSSRRDPGRGPVTELSPASIRTEGSTVYPMDKEMSPQQSEAFTLEFHWPTDHLAAHVLRREAQLLVHRRRKTGMSTDFL